MRTSLLRSVLLSFLATLTGAVFATANVEAAQPTMYGLPEATHAGSMAVSVTGTAWFVPSRGGKWEGSDSIVSSVSPDGAVTEHEVTALGETGTLTVGPLGEVWVAGYSGQDPADRVVQIGRLSASGALEQIYVVGQGGLIESMALSDGSLWFVTRRFFSRPSASLGRISADGTVDQIPLAKGCLPGLVAAGTEGTLWITESCRMPRGRQSKERAYVGKIDRQGQKVRHQLNATEWPMSFAVAPNGTAWFGISYTDKAGYETEKLIHVMKSGKVAGYRVHGYLRSIAADGQGRVWFASWAGWRHPRLGSLDLHGERRVVCGDPYCAYEAAGLVAAPDGSLWYGLASPNLNTGGGGSGLWNGIEIKNQAGFVGHLVP